MVPLLLNLSAALLLSQQPPSPLAQRVDAAIRAEADTFVAVRREIHLHPEVSGDEVRTAALVATRLRALGLEVRTEVGGHGVVALLRGGRPGPTVAYRADMDAVPDNSPDPVAFRSLAPGVRHICGHDLHTTIALAIASALAPRRAEIAGSILLVFQPAEERATGAKAMLADGVFGAERPVAIYALHTAPMQVGRLATGPGPTMAGRDRLIVSIGGAVDHSAAADAVRQILGRLGTLPPDQQFAPAETTLVMVQPFRGRGGSGVTEIAANITIASEQVRAAVRERLARDLAPLSSGGLTVTFEYQPKVIAGVTNDPRAVARGNAAISALLGDSTVRAVGTVLPAFSEDFGSFQDRVPGVMWFLGVSNAARGTVGMPHSPNYVADEGAITVGARAMAAVLLDRLESASGATSAH